MAQPWNYYYQSRKFNQSSLDDIEKQNKLRWRDQQANCHGFSDTVKRDVWTVKMQHSKYAHNMVMHEISQTGHSWAG